MEVLCTGPLSCEVKRGKRTDGRSVGSSLGRIRNLDLSSWLCASRVPDFRFGHLQSCTRPVWIVNDKALSFPKLAVFAARSELRYSACSMAEESMAPTLAIADAIHLLQTFRGTDLSRTIGQIEKSLKGASADGYSEVLTISGAKAEVLGTVTVQVLLGHSSSELTRQVYFHSLPEDRRVAAEKLEAHLFGPKLDPNCEIRRLMLPVVVATTADIGRGDRI